MARQYRPPVAASARPLDDAQLAHLRLNVEGDLLGVITSYGGQVIVSSPQMTAMIGQLADVVVEWAIGDRLADVLRLAP